MNKNNKIKIFIDFDGTISLKDTGEEIFLNFADKVLVTEIIKNWMTRDLSATEMWKKLFNLLPGISQEDLLTFLDNTIEIDHHFIEFLGICDQNNLDFYIVSDGFDFYINHLLTRSKLNNIPVFSNHLSIEKNKFEPHFPFTDEECNFCANCKRNRIIDLSDDNDITIYIGDGASDQCASQFCDYIIAKGTLLKFLEKNRISYFPFNNFHNVNKRLRELLNKPRLKKRHQASLKRKEVYEQG